MRSLAGVITFSIASIAATAFSGAPPAAPGAVAEEISQLASPDRGERIAAERKLIERGPAVLDRLPEPSAVQDVAVRAAVERIRKRLEVLRAKQALQPGRLVLPNAAAITEYVSLTSEQAERAGELSGEHGTYWRVIDDVARQIDGWPDRVLPDDQMTFRDRTPLDDRKRLAYVGPFRLAAGPAELKPIAGDASHRLVRVPLSLRAEPRLRPLFVSFAAKDLRLVTRDGKELRPFTPAAQYDLPFGDRGEAVDLRLDFLSTDDLRTPLSLSGSVTMTVAAGEERFAFPFDETTQSPAETSRGGVTVRVRQASLSDDGLATVELAVVYDRGGPAFESHRTWVYHNQAELVYQTAGETGPVEHRLDHEPGFSTIAQADGGVVLAYRFAGLPGDARDVVFVYEAPTSVIEAPVEFTIDRLPVAEPLNAGSDAGR